jgi:peptide/nickel transport system permease protein
MIRYLVVRASLALVVVYVVVTLVFLALRIVPGDPAELLLSGGGQAPSPAAVSALRHQLRLDQPIYAAYAEYLAGLVRGDLGTSYEDPHPVAEDVVTRLPRTLELIAAATALGIAAGVPLGGIAALRRGTLIDATVAFIAAASVSIPVFVLGTFMVLIFALQLGWAPAGSFTAITDDPIQHLHDLILPAVTLGFSLVGAVARMSRSAVLDVMHQDWVRTATAMGLSRRDVVIKHVFRNALAPIVTVTALQIGTLLGGTVLVEYVFNWPGLSSVLVQAAVGRDYPEVQGIVLVISVLFVLLNLLADLSYAVLDPRVRSVVLAS